MGDRVLQILQQALGLDRFGRGVPVRNHFVTGEGSVDHPDCLDAVARGLMTRHPMPDLFLVTYKGRDFIAEHSPLPDSQLANGGACS